ncbi:sacsin N-terminal ATP-binding-like domain-containing protein [Winogradskyella sediminis]|uniref:sacsin N-terminal ATP-binding-like domain-containing protein n=1 Tax=Winogradskyella sediminis TaxID=1382466 RepID=UPI003AA80901
MKIKELIKNRKEFVDAQIKNGFDLTTVLVGLYSDASHFVYEILQNAEDAKATEITFDLQKDKLIITHNGIHFSDTDIDAITGISNLKNDKKKDLEKIGKFGIGFKSVYAVTESPRIQSGIYDFQIINFVLPDKFSDNNNYTDTTITLNFEHKKLSSYEIFKLIELKFETFEYYNLLFLSNLKNITLKWNDNKIVFTKKEKAIKGSDLAFNSILSVNKEKHQYLVFKTKVVSEEFSNLTNKPNIAIAFKQETVNGVLRIVKSETSNLFAFFETGYETFLNYLIQAPFSTTPARDNIDFKLPVNLELLEELGQLMKSVLVYFRENKLISLDFLNQLPLDYKIDETKIVYWNFFHAVKEEFLAGGKYLPTMFKNNYQAVQDIAIVRGRELTSLISSVTDLQILFDKKYWMDTKITVDKTPELYNYFLNQLNIKEYTPDDFARKVTDDFFINKTDSWMIKFYEFLNGKQESLWRSGTKKDQGALRQKAIIRLNDGEHSKPFDSYDKPIVFLPLKKKKLAYTTVSPKVLQSKGSMGFIKEKLGIREPNLFDNIKNHIIPLYKTNKVNITQKTHLEHFQLILEVFIESSENFKDEIVELLRNNKIKFIHSVNAMSGEKSYQNYQDVYLPSDLLKQYFGFSENIYFINTNVYKNIDKEVLYAFFKKCNVRNYPWLLINELKLSNKQKEKLRLDLVNDSRITEWHGEKTVDHKLEGLEDIILQESLSKDNSQIIWNILLNYLNNESDKEMLFKSEYSWTYRNYYTAKFRSSILKILQETNWLYTNDSDVPMKPSEILLKDLAPDYLKSSEESIYLIKQLKFQTEAEQLLLGQLPPDRKELFSQFEAIQKLCTERGIDLATAIAEISQEADREAEKQELENAPEIDDMETLEDDFVPFDDSNVEGKEVGRNSSDESDKASQEPSKQKSPSSNQQSQQMKNDIGDRGEFLAMKHLKKLWSRKATLVRETETDLEFEDANKDIIKISLLNSTDKKGIGCDIIITKEEEEIEFIEVKSTKMEGKDLIPVNGYQWSLAYKKFKSGQGNKYSFFIVKNVLSKKAPIMIIKNPIKKWKDGELRAHPVNLEL